MVAFPTAEPGTTPTAHNIAPPKRAHPDSILGKILTRATTDLVISPMARYQFWGTQNLPKEGGFIAVANHVTDFDALTFTDFLFANGFQPRVLAKQDLFKIPVVGTLLRATGMIPVYRGTEKAASSLDAAADLLREGACVALFPEGTLSRDPDYWPMEGKTGAARLALATKVPVIPVGQWGAINILGRYSKVLKPFPRKLVKIAAGPPVDLSEFYDQPITAELLRAATSQIMDAITVLVAQMRGEPAPSPRFDLHLHPDYKKKKTRYPELTRP
ncbi:MAG: 1-acyl-sn-glycerol-3-phosphate acyltransferase [Promicromonosporaceae bacterium]|nr:1-acyl-sn-glycerol-3-phosphate acyltransferase [Promicromonosporaceae bacterium]